jgi:hypothetical protein
LSADLEGDLARFHTGDVLQLLALTAATGRLELERRGERVDIHLERGRAVAARTTGRAVRTGEALVHRGALRAAALAAALERQRQSPDQRIGVLLVESGAATPEQVHAAVDEVIRRILFGVTAWRDGRFAFFADEQRAPDPMRLELEIDRVVLEALTQADLVRDPR